MGDGLACTITPRARKPHRCEECGRTIQPGEIYERYAGTWEGSFFTNIACHQCAELRRAVNKVDDYYSEGYYGGLSDWIWQRMWVELPESVWSNDGRLVPLLRLVAGFESRWKTKSGAPWPT